MQKWKGVFLLVGVLVFSAAGRPADPIPGEAGMGHPVERGMTGKSDPAGEKPADPAGEAVTWMSLDEAAGKLEKEQRPVLIDLYTTWCGWCKQMDRKTYSNKQVAQYLREKFYPVKVDAESKAVINWKGKAYSFSADYKSNEFAVYLTHGQLEFPTTIIIPPGGEPQAVPGYMEPKELELLVRYFGEGKYNKVSFEVYQKSFKPSW